MNKISVIIPIYNMEAYLSRCIESVVGQSHKKLEIILVDDGSSDNCAQICDEYSEKDDRITVIHKENEGVSSARNVGMSSATGDYITFVDPDDWLETDALATMLALLNDGDAECVRTMYYKDRADGYREKSSLKSLTCGVYKNDDIHNLINDFVGGREHCYVMLLLFDKRVMNRIGGFNVDVCMMEDVLFYIKLLSAVDSMVLSNKLTYHYFQNDQSASRSPVNYRRNIGDILAVNAEVKAILNDKGLLTDELRETVDVTHAMLISNYLFRIYMNGSSSREITDMLLMLHRDEEYRVLVSGAPCEKMPHHLRYTVECIMHNRPKRLMAFFRLRLFAHNLKNRFKGLRN